MSCLINLSNMVSLYDFYINQNHGHDILKNLCYLFDNYGQSEYFYNGIYYLGLLFLFLMIIYLYYFNYNLKLSVYYKFTIF